MARTREERRNDFDEFYNSAKKTFTEISNNDLSVEKFEKIYMLHICPGSRAGGKNNRVVEVFWGSRPFETISDGRNWKSLTEYGATLLYERDDNGFVIVSIFPANTDNRKPIESSITLNIWLDPIKLKKVSYLKKHWNDLVAYMEYTSLDGNPTFLQKQRIFYLRTFKHLVITNKSTETRISKFIGGLFKLILAAVFSGAVLIYFINFLNKPTKTEILLDQVNKNLDKISIQLNKISESSSNLKSISTIDSVAKKTKGILEPILKKKN